MQKEKQGVLSGEKEKKNGPFDSRNRQVMVFSIGAGNESHGAALACRVHRIGQDDHVRLGKRIDPD